MLSSVAGAAQKRCGFDVKLLFHGQKQWQTSVMATIGRDLAKGWHLVRRRRESLESSWCYQAHAIALDFATTNADQNEAVARAQFWSRSSFVPANTYFLLAESFLTKTKKRSAAAFQYVLPKRYGETELFHKRQTYQLLRFRNLGVARSHYQPHFLSVCVWARVGTHIMLHCMFPMISGFRMGP